MFLEKQRRLLDQMHDFWVDEADLVFTPSEMYLAELERKSASAYLLPHGVDFLDFGGRSVGAMIYPKI